MQETQPQASDGARQDDCPYVTLWTNHTPYSLKINSGTKWENQPLKPPVGTIINSGQEYDYCVFADIQVEIYSGANATGNLIGIANVVLESMNAKHYLRDIKNYLVFIYNENKSGNFDSCYNNYHGQDIKLDPGIPKHPGPPVITNEGWTSGMGNDYSEATGQASFWMQDYDGNEEGRWTAQDGAIGQSTQVIDGNSGSRAFPAYIAYGSPRWSIFNCDAKHHKCTNKVANGTAFEGCWQMDIKCGSDGTQHSHFCETFYLAERANLNPGSKNYEDANGGSGSNENFAREIDIMETAWSQGGPQVNLPGGKQDKPPHTAWNLQWGGKKMADWSDIGGMPMNDFATFGCLIRDVRLWIYAYKPSGELWYCTDAIKMDNDMYKQKNPFVPYIGTWCLVHPNVDGNFKTLYKNFVYLEAHDPKIAGKNPHRDPTVFGQTLVNS